MTHHDIITMQEQYNKAEDNIVIYKTIFYQNKNANIEVEYFIYDSTEQQHNTLKNSIM